MSRAGKAINDQRDLFPGRLRGAGKGKRDLAQPAQVRRGTPPSLKTAGVALGWGGIPGSREHVVESEEEGVAAGGGAAAAACSASWPHCEAAQGRGSGGGKEGSALALPHALTHNRSRSGPSEKAACQTLTKEPVWGDPHPTSTTRAPRLSLPPASRLLLETGAGGCRFYTESPSWGRNLRLTSGPTNTSSTAGSPTRSSGTTSKRQPPPSLPFPSPWALAGWFEREARLQMADTRPEKGIPCEEAGKPLELLSSPGESGKGRALWPGGPPASNWPVLKLPRPPWVPFLLRTSGSTESLLVRRSDPAFVGIPNPRCVLARLALGLGVLLGARALICAFASVCGSNTANLTELGRGEREREATASSRRC